MPSDVPTQALKNLKKCLEYYHPGGDLTVIVGDTCFRVASVFFTRESSIFRERLQEGTAKPGDGKAQQGQKTADTSEVCVKQTIVIESHENVTPDDFALFCSIFFNQKFSIYEKELHQWEIILRLANQWQFEEVRQLAFREIDRPGKFPIALVDRIVLYRKYAAPHAYIEPLFEELLIRLNSVSEEEGQALGLKLTIAIQSARERLLRTLGSKLEVRPLPTNVKDSILRAVRELLELPALANRKPVTPPINTGGQDRNNKNNRGGQ